MFMPAASSSQQRTLADLIMAKIREKEERDAAGDSAAASSTAEQQGLYSFLDFSMLVLYLNEFLCNCAPHQNL